VPLPVPRTTAGRAGLDALLADPGRALVGFDFDGTLAPIVDDPEQARAHPGVRPALERLAPSLGRVAVVTGRPATTAVEYSGLAGLPGLTVLGHYGLERWTAGEVQTPSSHPGVESARDRLPRVLADASAPAGTAVEDKGHAVAVHVRRAADPAAAMAAVEGPLRRLADETGLAVEPGRMVLELRPPGMDKGAALRGLLEQETPSVVVFAGDDLGDLAAFAAVEDARAAGIPGLLVCSGSTEVTALAERADLVVDGPAGVVALLDELAAALERGPGDPGRNGLSPGRGPAG
jgi:trehalose 6-phosphate phosphatase